MSKHVIIENFDCELNLLGVDSSIRIEQQGLPTELIDDVSSCHHQDSTSGEECACNQRQPGTHAGELDILSYYYI
jgi:hypothetical protein